MTKDSNSGQRQKEHSLSESIVLTIDGFQRTSLRLWIEEVDDWDEKGVGACED